MTSNLIWLENTQVKSYETDFLKNWKLSAYFQTMEEVATHHAASFGFSLETMLERKMIWILSRVKIQFYQPPKVQETVKVETWPRGVQQKIFFGRDFNFLSEADQPLASASTLWILINPDTRRIVMPQSLTQFYPAMSEKMALDETLEKIGINHELTPLYTAKVGYSSVDLMGHVNNARYIDWIGDAFSSELFEGEVPGQIQINYLNEVKPGDTISISGGLKDGQTKTWVIEGNNTTTQARSFEAELKWK